VQNVVKATIGAYQWVVSNVAKTMEGTIVKDPRHAIRTRIAQQEIGSHTTPLTDGNLALAGNSAPEAVTKGNERTALIEVLVTGLVGCLAEMKAHNCNKPLLRRSLVELRNLARTNHITAEEVIGEFARRVGVRLDLVLIAHDVEQQEDEVAATIREHCPIIPEVRPQGHSHDPHRFIADDDLDQKTGLSHTRFVAAESASDLYVTTRRPAGMTGGKNIPRDLDTGQFVGVTA
jgi:hypothetical protein